MADNNRSIIGVPGAPNQNSQIRGMPGSQPPTPSQDQIARVMAEQQRQRQIDMEEARRRTAILAKEYGNENPEIDDHNYYRQNIPNQIPSEVINNMPPEMRQQLNGYQQQDSRSNRNMSTQNSNQFERFSEPKEIVKTKVPWFPIRSKGVDVELEHFIITNVPEKGPLGEGDAQAKVILSLFSEVLTLKDYVENMSAPPIDESLSQRVQRLEAILFEQSKSLKAQTRAVREQIEMYQAKGMSSDEIIKALNDQSKAAEEAAG